MDDTTTNDLAKYLKALLAVQIKMLSRQEPNEKPEILLSGVGMSARDIAEVLGKSADAVKKSIQRAGKKAA